MSVISSSLFQSLSTRRAELPEAQQRVVDVLLQGPQAAVGATVEQLAQRAGVSMPTVVRTCRSFGYASVREFMLALAQDIAVDASFLHRSVVADDTAADILGKIIRSATASMSSLERQIDPSALERAAVAIAAAERVDCYSAGATSTFISNDLQGRLARLGVNSNAYFDAHQQLVSACTLGANGVAVAISHVGRMPTLLEAARFARSQGATVIALTQADAPLADCADIVLGATVPEDAVMRVGTEAYIAHLLVIEILTVLVGKSLGPRAVERLRTFRSVLEEHGIDSASHIVTKMAWSKAEREQQ